ncbi:MAG: hypothetical protein RI897_2689 [Verrucomicrobiota bacterium]
MIVRGTSDVAWRGEMADRGWEIGDGRWEMGCGRFVRGGG